MNKTIKHLTNGDFEVEHTQQLKFYDNDHTDPLASVHIEEFEHGEFQLRFSVGVQHFDIGPRYDVKEEAEWFMSQFCHALGVFSAIIGTPKQSEDREERSDPVREG